ncbi:MAG: hypothetical protein Q9182_002758 [Xanthomendoza sp. 2 TL-2023]
MKSIILAYIIGTVTLAVHGVLGVALPGKEPIGYTAEDEDRQIDRVEKRVALPNLEERRVEQPDALTWAVINRERFIRAAGRCWTMTKPNSPACIDLRIFLTVDLFRSCYEEGNCPGKRDIVSSPKLSLENRDELERKVKAGHLVIKKEGGDTCWLIISSSSSPACVEVQEHFDEKLFYECYKEAECPDKNAVISRQYNPSVHYL